MMMQSLRRRTLRALRRSRLVSHRFARRQDGSAAVEFALVAAPFLLLLFAILETALVFFAGQTLQVAAANSARLIMTGQAQQANYSVGDFKNAVCNQIAGLFDCSKIYVDVKSYSTFGAINSTAPVANGELDKSKLGYSLQGPGCIQVVSLYYQWPIYVSMLQLSNLSGNYFLMSATSVFKNEPYSTSGTC